VLATGFIASPAFAAEAPSCIARGTTTSGLTKTFWATSSCYAETYRIIFRVSWHVDSSCYSIFYGDTISFTIANGTPAALESVDLC
jgi:hypothetical protein